MTDTHAKTPRQASTGLTTGRFVEFVAENDDDNVVAIQLQPGEKITGQFRLHNTWDGVEAFTTSHGRLFYFVHQWGDLDPSLAERVGD